MKESVVFSPNIVTEADLRGKYDESLTDQLCSFAVTATAIQLRHTWLSTVGTDIRTLRKRRSMTLTQLAEAVKRSVGFISQIERGLSEPSIDDLRAIAATFNVPISFFFQQDEQFSHDDGRHVVRAGERRRLGNAEGALFEELLSPDLGGAFEIVRSEFAPGASLSQAQQRNTEEAGYIISGNFDIEIGGIWHCLEAGDSFRFAGEPYRWKNTGTTPAVLVWIIAPPVY